MNEKSAFGKKMELIFLFLHLYIHSSPTRDISIELGEYTKI